MPTNCCWRARRKRFLRVYNVHLYTCAGNTPALPTKSWPPPRRWWRSMLIQRGRFPQRANHGLLGAQNTSTSVITQAARARRGRRLPPARVPRGVGGDSLLCSGLPESFVRRPGPRQPVPKARHVLSSGYPRVRTKAGLGPRRGGNQSGLAVSPGSIPEAAEELVRVVRARRSDEVGPKEPTHEPAMEACDRSQRRSARSNSPLSFLGLHLKETRRRAARMCRSRSRPRSLALLLQDI